MSRFFTSLYLYSLQSYVWQANEDCVEYVPRQYLGPVDKEYRIKLEWAIDYSSLCQTRKHVSQTNTVLEEESCSSGLTTSHFFFLLKQYLML